MSFPSKRITSQERCLFAITSVCVNLSHVNYARKRPLTIRITKDNIIAVVYDVRLFYLALITAKITIKTYTVKFRI